MPAPGRYLKQNAFILETKEGRREIPIYSEEGFELLSHLWVRSAWQQKIYARLTWMGIPIYQIPEDLLMLQELVFRVQPTVILETGTAHGGSATFYASMLDLLGKGRVLSLGLHITEEARRTIEAHPMGRRITLIPGSSTDSGVRARIRELIRPEDKVLVALDSDHSSSHVRAELEAYAPLVTPGSYAVVFDGIMEVLADAPDGKSKWTTDNPSSAVRDFLSAHPEFEADPHYNRLRVTYCPGGFLRRKAS